MRANERLGGKLPSWKREARRYARSSLLDQALTKVTGNSQERLLSFSP